MRILDLYPIPAAARVLGVTPERVRQLVLAGKLRTVSDASGRRLIPGASLRRFQRQRAAAKPARPR